MNLVEIVEHVKLQTQKRGADFIYEMKLEKYLPTGEYKFSRRWNYKNKLEETPWTIPDDFSTDQQEEFNRKRFQKEKLLGYQNIT